MAIESRNPSTGQLMATFQEHGAEEIEQRLELSIRTFRAWRHTSLAHRLQRLEALGILLERDEERLGRLMTLEMGKPLSAARAEARKCASACRYYVEHGAQLMADEEVPLVEGRAFVRHEPLGPVLAVMPWNFPFWQVIRFAAPAVTAGNTGLLKHASNVPQCALALEHLFLEAGFPQGVFQTLLIGANKVPPILADSRIVAATLTGSEPAGRAVASQAGAALKKTVMELGGSDPFLVLESAKVSLAAATGIKARLINNGQSCIAAKRFIVHASVYDEFLDAFVEGMSNIKQGDPFQPDVELGPLATEQIRTELHDQVERCRAGGAQVLLGGFLPRGEGYFYPATVITGISPASTIAREEFFGPVALIFKVESCSEAIALANDTPFGLGAAVFAEDPVEIDSCISGIEAGMVFVNGMVASDARLPFGGIKNSGYGRELAGPGLKEFMNLKTVWIR